MGCPLRRVAPVQLPAQPAEQNIAVVAGSGNIYSLERESLVFYPGHWQGKGQRDVLILLPCGNPHGEAAADAPVAVRGWSPVLLKSIADNGLRHVMGILKSHGVERVPVPVLVKHGFPESESPGPFIVAICFFSVIGEPVVPGEHRQIHVSYQVAIKRILISMFCESTT